jgi:peptidoglycan/LPS O-acetylase OafA/YrhL
VFVFLSAYGIARSTIARPHSWLTFMLKRAWRIYPTFLLAIAVHAIFFLYPWEHGVLWTLKVYLLRLTMLANFWPGLQLALVGPWWFFSLVFQFYAVYWLLDLAYDRFRERGLLVIAAVALLATAGLNPILEEYGQNLFFTVIGHMPVLCLGIYMAHAGVWMPGKAALCAIGVVFGLGNWFAGFWYLAPLCATILLITFLRASQSLLGRSPFVTAIQYVGGISLPLFAVHGMLRGPFKNVAAEHEVWYMTLALGAAFLAWSVFVAELMRWLEIRLRTKMASIQLDR